MPAARSIPARLAGAAVGGALLAVSFPPLSWAWLTPLAVAVLTLVVRGVRLRAAFALGLTGGIVFFALLMRWMTVIGPDAWLSLSAFCALWIGGVGVLSALLQARTRWWPVWVALVWVLEEALRDRVPLGGFPWGRLAFAQTDTWLTPYAALAGAPLVTLATALLGTLLALVALAGRTRRWRCVAGAAAGIAAVATAGLLVPLPTDGEGDGGPATTVAAVVQGSVPELGMGAMDQRRAVLDNHVRQTILLAERAAAGAVPAPELVIWPENSSDLDPYVVPEAAAAISAAAATVDAPILVGAVVTKPDDPTRVLNVGIVWDPVTGPGDRYAKTHPVPFGEYVPFRSVLARFISRFDRVPRDFAGGDVPGVLQVGPALVGDVICFEVSHDEIVRDVVTGGARILMVQTNNATYGLTGQPEQQLAMSRLRAVEHGRAVLVAATSGISAVIAPDGTVQQSLPEPAAGSLVATVPLRDSATLATRLGAWPEWLAALAAVAVCIVAARRPDIGWVPVAPAAPEAEEERR